MVPDTPSFRRIFWDVNISTLDEQKHRRQIVERILNFGDECTYRWLFATYSEEELKEEVRRNKNIEPRAGAMMANLLDMPREEAACFRNAYPAN